MGVTITWAISCGLESSSSSSSCYKQPTTGRYFPRPYYYPPPTRMAGLWLPLTRNCLYSPSCREEPFSETQRYIKEPRRRKPSPLEHVSNNTPLLDWPTRPRPRCSPAGQPCRRVRQAGHAGGERQPRLKHGQPKQQHEGRGVAD